MSLGLWRDALLYRLSNTYELKVDYFFFTLFIPFFTAMLKEVSPVLKETNIFMSSSNVIIILKQT